MNEQISKLIESLAETLGTTTEYIWEILIQQAKISAIKSALYITLTIVFGIILYKVHIVLLKKDEHEHSKYWHFEEAVVVPMIITAIVWFILACIGIPVIGNLFNALFNPEYWALREILNTL